MILYKLRCGNEEISLTDWVTFYPLKGGLADDGETVTIHLYVKEDCRASAALTNWLHRIHQLSQRAVEYETAMIGQPVMLGCKVDDGNPYDTTFGRGWYWKYLLGTSTQDAIEVNPTEQWDNTIHQGFISDLELIFHTKPRIGYDGAPIYAWEPLYQRWVGSGCGALRSLPGGGLFLEEEVFNLLPNSDFENEASRQLNWTAEAGLTPSVITEQDLVYFGFASIKLVCAGADKFYYQSWTSANTNTYCISFYVRRLDGGLMGDDYCHAYYNGALATTFEAEPSHPGWYRAYATFTGVVAARNTGVLVHANKTVIVDSFQVEECGYPTSLIYGNMGTGYIFAGTVHNSASYRTGGECYFQNVDSNVERMWPIDKGTVLIAWEVPYVADLLAATWINRVFINELDGSRQIRFLSTAAGWQFTDGTNTIATGAITLVKGDTILIFAKYGPTGLALRIYRDGVLIDSVTGANYTTVNAGTIVRIGSISAGPCKIHEVQIWHEELTDLQCDERAECGVGGGELPFIYGVVADLSLYNNVYCMAEMDNFPGDFEAGANILLKNRYPTTAVEYQYVYMGQMRRAVPRPDLPSKHLLIGNFCNAVLEAEDGSASYDGDTATVGDGTCSGANKSQTTPSDLDEHLRIAIPICNEPEDLWKYVGRWRIIPRMHSDFAETFRVRFRVVTGGQAGDYTEQVYLDGEGVWRPVTPTKLIVDIPSLYIAPDSLQQYKPGDWDSTADGPYCYLEYYLQADALGVIVDLDYILLLPQDQEGWATIDGDEFAYQRVLSLNTCGHEFSWGVVYDKEFERHVVGFDWSGQRFTIPPHSCCTMVFMWRRYDTGSSWVITDNLSLQMKYKPRYRRIR